MYDLSVTCVDNYVADAAIIIRIEYQVAGLKRIDGNRCAVACLCLCGPCNRISEVQIYLLCKTGAIHAACQAVASVYIRITNILECTVCNLNAKIICA